MEVVMLGTADVFVLYPDRMEIKMGCKKCGKLLASTAGKFLIGLRVIEKGQESKYFIASDELVSCCGEQKIILKMFDNEIDANAEMKRLCIYLDEHKSTEGLKLVPIPPGSYENN